MALLQMDLSLIACPYKLFKCQSGSKFNIKMYGFVNLVTDSKKVMI